MLPDSLHRSDEHGAQLHLHQHPDGDHQSERSFGSAIPSAEDRKEQDHQTNHVQQGHEVAVRSLPCGTLRDAAMKWRHDWLDHMVQPVAVYNTSACT
ncbi:hypothetical protein [Shimazuella alba]|uniref:Uncharacterized protein n=1 Tax=Shimazuella alba TaxID=2690964 RepID=A0A6I4VY84_9BACL|nr:hypothetical protein [Shimazuella alba]MXQ55701.1 hypothetical protein [Shimazuella alba]